MISLLRRYRQPLIVSMVVVFFIGIFVGLGGYFFTGADHSEAVAVVDGEKIPYFRFRNRANQYVETLRSQGTEVTEETTARIKQDLLRDMIVDEILAQEAGKMGLRVSDGELALAIQNTPGFQRDGRFDQGLYFQSVRFQFGSNPAQFEEAQRHDMLAGKLKALMFRNAKILPGELRAEYLRAKAGPIRDFEKNKERFAGELRQRRALDTVNFFLRQRAANADIRSYLEQRERGL